MKSAGSQTDMGSSSKDLLQLENKYFVTPSSLESILSVCENDSGPRKPPAGGKPLTTPVPQSQVLGKVRDFIGVISEANKRLQEDAKDNSEKYDIETLTGNESEVVEMDLMLGIADLHTPEAVAAAESAIGNGHPLNSLAASSSESESEDTSDESKSDDEASDDTESDGEDNGNDNNKTCKPGNNDSTEGIVKQCSKRQRKIVELS
ncbi:PREDICTED: uncharacterized protein LOC105133321 isoform X1 [Populus euphratica]|uniref:Uncharacterized protein LOC105133321 isoform X1 n=2 Tax=Populus euphratica TaxID=75702 RepID=A0AAJ6UUH3_POPEU|nr:PREDICTED: uncharacterized protein LOC105133321 isoform X1 [Populus euphratica]